MPELQVLNGSLQSMTIPVTGERFLIGRKESCHLVLKDGWVSREHTLIMEPRPGEFRVQDLDSENGTFLNGERVRDTAMRHGDVLRVGRTEMRFTQHGPGSERAMPAPPPPVASTEPGPRTEVASRQEIPAGEQTMKVDALSRTTAEGPRPDEPRIDLRERVRRLEESLLEGEQANASLAAENAVLKRALARLGVLDRKTGGLDVSKLTPAPPPAVPDAMLPFVMNPLARIRFPGAGSDGGDSPEPGAGFANPALFRLGVVGIDAVGIRFAECLSRLGYRGAAAITAEREAMRGGAIDPAWRIFLDRPRAADRAEAPRPDDVFVSAMPRIEEVFGEAFSTCDHVLLCAAASAPLCAGGLTRLVEVVRRSGAKPGVVLFFDSSDDHVQSHAQAVAAFAAARSLVESGRLAPCLVVDQARAAQLEDEGAPDRTRSALDALAGALDALLRLPVMPPSGPSVDPAAVGKVILAKGWATIGLAATRGRARADVEAVHLHALGAGLTASAMPPSRARAAFVATVVGGDHLPVEGAVEGAHGALGRVLPQAQRVDGLWRDPGKSIRVLAWVGGLPFPETFFSHGHS